MKRPNLRRRPEKKTESKPIEVAEEHSTADYANYKKPSRFNLEKPAIGLPAFPSRLVKILILVILIGAAAAAAYTFFTNPGKGKDTAGTQTAQNSSGQLPTTISTKTKNYNSANLNLAFDYPDDWTVKDGDGILTVTSPTMTLKSSDGSDKSGQIIMTIRSKGQELTEFDSGPATAALISEIITYSNPTPSQRGNTHLSFLRYNGNFAGLDGIYITGDNGYKKDQDVPKVDFAAVDPVVSVTFTGCSDNSCSDAAPLTVTEGVWKDKSFADPIKSMLQSLSIN